MGKLYLTLATKDGKRVSKSAAPRRRMRTSTRRSFVNLNKVLKGQLDVLGLGGSDKALPLFRGNPLPLPPLADSPDVLVERLGNSRSMAKGLKKVSDGCEHVEHNHLDYRSSQERTTVRVTDCPGPAKNRRMGRGATPTKFKVDFCKRLAAARTMAKLTQEQVAKELGMLPNTYSKYERRTVLPSHLVPVVCDLLKIDERFLFRGDPMAERKSA